MANQIDDYIIAMKTELQDHSIYECGDLNRAMLENGAITIEQFTAAADLLVLEYLKQ